MIISDADAHINWQCSYQLPMLISAAILTSSDADRSSSASHDGGAAGAAAVVCRHSDQERRGENFTSEE